MFGEAEEENEFQVKIINGAEHKFYPEMFARLRILDVQRKMCVLAIIGIQATGKSTFLNQYFGTRLRQMSTENVVKTTDGATLCVRNDHYILDFEGSDSQQGSTTIENRLALFAFYVSDVVLVNIDTLDLGRRTNALHGMLHTVLSAALKSGKILTHKISLIALLRNPQNLVSETLQAQSEVLRAKALEFFETIWESVQNRPAGRHFTDIFDFDAIPLRYDNRILNAVDLDLVRTRIRAISQSYQTSYYWICRHWESAWREILQNDRLDTPDFQQLAERERLQMIYQELRPSLLQKYEMKVERAEPMDTGEAKVAEVKAEILEALFNGQKYSIKGREFITKCINDDISRMFKKWEETYLRLIETKVTAILGEIKLFLGSLTEREQIKTTFAQSVKKIRQQLAEIMTFPQIVHTSDLTKGATALLDKLNFLSHLQNIFFTRGGIGVMQVARTDLEERLNRFAELSVLVLGPPRINEFVSETLQKYDHYRAAWKAELLLEERLNALLVTATTSIIDVKGSLKTLEREVLAVFNQEAGFTLQTLAQIPLAITIEAVLEKFQRNLHATQKREINLRKKTEEATRLREAARDAMRNQIFENVRNEVISTKPVYMLEQFDYTDRRETNTAPFIVNIFILPLFIREKSKLYLRYQIPYGCKVKDWEWTGLASAGAEWGEGKEADSYLIVQVTFDHRLAPFSESSASVRFTGVYLKSNGVENVTRSERQAWAYAEAEVNRIFP